jgi:mono/diheme cytochrome c family protein
MRTKLYKGQNKAILMVLVLVGNVACSSFSLAGDDSAIASGAKLFQALACVGCHTCNGHGNPEGLDLDEVSFLSRQELEVQLKTPRHLRIYSRMPSFAFVQPQELQNLLNFLQGPK